MGPRERIPEGGSLEECPCAICRGAPGEDPIFQDLFEAPIEEEYVYQDDWQWAELEGPKPEPDQGIFDPLARMEKYDYNPFTAMLEGDAADQVAGFIFLDFLDWLFE